MAKGMNRDPQCFCVFKLDVRWFETYPFGRMATEVTKDVFVEARSIPLSC
jgi:hypothetical protein